MKFDGTTEEGRRAAADHAEAQRRAFDPKRGGTEPATTGDELNLDVFAPAAETTTELVANFGLEPEQEIRDRALERAIASVTRYPGAEHHLTVLDLAKVFAGWIRTGQRPDSPVACTCTPIDGEPGLREGDPQCPQHGAAGVSTDAHLPRCRYRWSDDRWSDNVTTHICWEPAGHDGEHRCRLGPCRQQPTTTPREAS